MFGRTYSWNETATMPVQCHTADDVRQNARRLRGPVPMPVVSFARPVPVKPKPVFIAPRRTETIAACMMVIALMWKEPNHSHFTTQDVLRAVCKHFRVSKEDILCQARTQNFVRPRHVAMYLTKELTGRSLPEIGRRFAGRDHTTVLSAIRKIETLLITDVELAATVEEIRGEIVAGAQA